MENYRYVYGVIFIILSSIFYDSFGNEVQTNFQKFKVMQRALLAEIIEQQLLDEKLTDAERKYAELLEAVKRIEGKPEFRLPEHYYDAETRFEKKVDVIVRESEEPTSKVENVTRCEDKQTAENIQTNFQKFKVMQRALLAEIIEQQLLDEKLTDAERKYAELLEAVKSIEGKPEFRLPEHYYDAETRFEKKVDVIVRESEEPTSKVENVTRCEDKQTAENNQSHFANNGVNVMSDLSCHVKDQCNNNPFNATPCFVIISRKEWMARCTRGASHMHTPVGIVFIHHSAMPRCFTSQNCMLEVKNIQDLHMDTNGWDDIGYSFVVGEDGNAYEGRGWDRVGAHTRGWNGVSISIAVMGNFSYVSPSEPALQAINSVISCGILLGKVAPDYKLFGHRDASPTFESPGHMLYSLMQTWSHCKNRLP